MKSVTKVRLVSGEDIRERILETLRQQNSIGEWFRKNGYEDIFFERWNQEVYDRVDKKGLGLILLLGGAFTLNELKSEIQVARIKCLKTGERV